MHLILINFLLPKWSHTANSSSIIWKSLEYLFSKIQLFFIFLVCSHIKSSYGHVNYIIRFLGCFYITKNQWKSFASTFPYFLGLNSSYTAYFKKVFLKVKNELCSDFSKIHVFFIFLVCSHIKSSYDHVNYIIWFLGCFYITKKQCKSFASTFPLFFRPEFILHNIFQKAVFECQKWIM